MKYYIITNLNGNDIGEYGWILEHDSERHGIQREIIEVSEVYSGRGATVFVPRTDLTEITEDQYNELSELLNKGEDTTALLTTIIGHLRD